MTPCSAPATAGSAGRTRWWRWRAGRWRPSRRSLAGMRSWRSSTSRSVRHPATCMAARRCPIGCGASCCATAAAWWSGSATDGRSSLGRSTRIVPTRLRQLIEERDRGCRVPGCTATRVQIHHLRHWEDGGVTAPSNLVALCHRHHRLHHGGGLQIDGDPERPDGLVFIDRFGRSVGYRPVVVRQAAGRRRESGRRESGRRGSGRRRRGSARRVPTSRRPSGSPARGAIRQVSGYGRSGSTSPPDPPPVPIQRE